ncbi:hypothetical protein Pcinc_017313 [Petrolisthes cinctipes]|uniref:Uncharacterized protein n=1 Tax=Petrolisthes cinctipes TaxID=88211 RepID=A0AAE1FQY7_PETCI|nr:hypothetical protein Pcinc_017313 [Petrolisthes cinctipes]
MSLNGDKFELLRYGPTQDMKQTTEYKCQNQLIMATDHVKDLGVHMSTDLTFSHHFNKITKTVNNHPRRGRLCFMRRAGGASQRVHTLIHHSFTFTGTRLFNSVPREIRNLTGITPDSFKNKLDKWLATVPDQPPTPGYTSTNSLQSVVHNMRREELPGTSGRPR